MLYIVRHGQTDWNAERRLQGQQDIPLNATGKLQAAGNGRALSRLIGPADRFDHVASPLTRTRQTMELILSAMGRDPSGYRTDTRLVEICFGDWEGRTIEEIEAVDAARIAERDANKWHFIPPGEKAESYEILSWRIGSWLKTVDEPTICVCHGGVIRCIFVLTGSLTPEEAAHLDIPQDKILAWDGTRLEWLDGAD